jgi:hypothetical protein
MPRAGGSLVCLNWARTEEHEQLEALSTGGDLLRISSRSDVASYRIARDRPLSQLSCSRKARSRFRQAFVDHGQERRRSERLAQAARRAEFKRHPQEIGRRRIEVGKGVARHRDQRNARGAFVEDSDRLEAAHVRHENVDNHQVEPAALQRPQPGVAAVGDRDLEIVPSQIDVDGHADRRIIVHNENALHAVSPRLDPLASPFDDSWIVVHTIVLLEIESCQR